ncbi:MAG: MetQ/NlpA family ABC transporter substrate-binding protein [Veillonella sp.]|nr:MetQ/NlpA family ABC transporter substrate-binding protein [Veillonella sp.]
MKFKKLLALGAALVFSVAFIAGCGSNNSDNGAKKELTYSKSQGPYSELFEKGVKPILEKQGYTFKGVDMSDLVQADQVLGIFSGSKTSLDQVADGDTIAVPNDASNMARAYALLQKIGWIKLDPNKDLATVTQADIVENPKHLKFTEMKSLTIPSVRTDFDYIVITGAIIYNAKIDPKSALANEDVLPQWLLQLVVNEKNKDAQWAKDIVAAYQSQEFKDYMEKNNNGLWFVPKGE